MGVSSRVTPCGDGHSTLPDVENGTLKNSHPYMEHSRGSQKSHFNVYQLSYSSCCMLSAE